MKNKAFLRHDENANLPRAVLSLAMCCVALTVVGAEPVTTGQELVKTNPDESSSAGTVAASLPGEPDLLLLGTVLLPDPGNPLAIIQHVDTGEQALYRLGDIVAGGRLVTILRDSVALTFAESEIELHLNAGKSRTPAEMVTVTERVQPPLSQMDGLFWRVERQTLDDLSRAPELISNVKPLNAGGVRVEMVQADGIFQKLGLKKDDIIRNINGQVPGEDLSLQDAIVQTEMGEMILRLEIDRKGQMDFLYYQFDP